MVLAFDAEGYEAGPATLPCPGTITEAIRTGEIPLTSMLKEKGYAVDALMTAATGEPELCGTGDMNYEDRYYGMSFHPYELIFIKSNRGIGSQKVILEQLNGPPAPAPTPGRTGGMTKSILLYLNDLPINQFFES
ncbi:hypothetical protein PhCBS80983_g01954 [Powellomyces hirtus]|uniref:Uncharacterized protein n=1 Tax=Powellomyces hirtus TaxID=109895 RepID=A0A507E8D4_9FUNG|nr:hypothetical protein PhCBS80983_g01954 [Powellomyces hirtus]